MEVKLAARGPNYIELEITGVDFGIISSLQEILNNYADVEYAGTNLTHPLIGKIRFVLRTKNETSPEDVLTRGLSELSQTAKNLRTVISELLKLT